MESIGGFDNMSIREPPQSLTVPGFSISTQGLGRVTPKLGYLAKSSKCTVHFLGHEVRNEKRTKTLVYG